MVPAKKVTTRIRFKSLDESNYISSKQASTSCLLTSSLGGSNVFEDLVILVSTKIKKPRWYQFWRWHLIPKYRQEIFEAKRLFEFTYGIPNQD